MTVPNYPVGPQNSEPTIDTIGRVECAVALSKAVLDIELAISTARSAFKATHPEQVVGSDWLESDIKRELEARRSELRARIRELG